MALSDWLSGLSSRLEQGRWSWDAGWKYRQQRSGGILQLIYRWFIQIGCTYTAGVCLLSNAIHPLRCGSSYHSSVTASYVGSQHFFSSLEIPFPRSVSGMQFRNDHSSFQSSVGHLFMIFFSAPSTSLTTLLLDPSLTVSSSPPPAPPPCTSHGSDPTTPPFQN